MTVKHQSILKRLTIDWPAHHCEDKACDMAHILPKELPITLALTHNAKNIIKLKLGHLLSGWSKQEQIKYEGIRAIVTRKFDKNYCECDPRPKGTLLNLQHMLSCTKHRAKLGDLQAAYGHHPRSIVWDAERALEGPWWKIAAIARRLKAMTLNLAKSFYQTV